MRLSNQTYDILKWVQKILVLLATFYTTLANIWGLPFGDEISKTCLALATFLLGLLEIASAIYNKEINADSELERDDAPNMDIVSHEDIDGVG